MLLEHKVHFRAKMIISLTFDVFDVKSNDLNT